MTVTSCKAKANRENAQKSTGPKSVEGKERSSRNASAPPLESLLLPPESGNRDFTIILLELQEDLAPRGVMQGMLVERIASILWKIRRLQQAEEHLTHGCAAESLRNKRLALRENDPESMLGELGEHDRKHFESILDDSPIDATARDWYVAALAADSRQITWMQKYELQLQRTLHAAMREWHRLRKAAAEEEKPAEEDLDLADLMKSTSRSTRLARLYEAEIAETLSACPAPENEMEQSSADSQGAPPEQSAGARSVADDVGDGHLPDLEAPQESDSDDADPEPPPAADHFEPAAANSPLKDKTIKNEAKVKMEKVRKEASPQARSSGIREMP